MPVQVSLTDNIYFMDSQGILDWHDHQTSIKLAALKGATFGFSLRQILKFRRKF